jgi:hypothetical protein
MAKAETTRIAIIETLTAGKQNLHTYTINGFSGSCLARAQSDSRSYPGFANKMDEFIVLHPYFLRPGENRIAGDYALGEPEDVNKQGSSQLTARVVSTAWPVERSPGEPYAENVLTTFQSPVLSKMGEDTARLEASFDWKQSTPAWGWTRGILIEDAPATRASLYAAYIRFHDGLAALHATPPVTGTESPFIKATRESMREFIQACELRKAPYHRLADLEHVAITLSTPGIELQAKRDAEEGERLRNEPAAPASDGRQLEPRPPLDEHGQPMTWLSLQSLPALDETTLEVFAGGTLAKLRGSARKPTMISFIYNGHGGTWGNEQFLPFLSLEVWFRREADGSWAVDGLWPSTGSSSVAHTLTDLMDDDSRWGAR